MLFDCKHPRLRNLNSIVFVDGVNSTRVPVRVSINKLNLVPEWILPFTFCVVFALFFPCVTACHRSCFALERLQSLLGTLTGTFELTTINISFTKYHYPFVYFTGQATLATCLKQSD